MADPGFEGNFRVSGLKPILQKLKRKYKDKTIVDGLTFQEFISQFYKDNNTDACLWAISDNIYIPKRFVKKASVLYEELSPSGIHLEILTPMLLHGIAKEEDIITLTVKDLWTYDRAIPWEFYGPENSHFLHPLKWADAKLGHEKPFCKYHIPHIIDFENTDFIYHGKRHEENLRKWIPPPARQVKNTRH